VGKLGQCGVFEDRRDCLQSIYRVQTGGLSRIMDETDDRHGPVEDGASGGSDCEARGQVVLKLMIDLEKLELFRGIRNRSFELSLCPDG